MIHTRYVYRCIRFRNGSYSYEYQIHNTHCGLCRRQTNKSPSHYFPRDKRTQQKFIRHVSAFMISGSTDRFISIQLLFSIYFVFVLLQCCLATDKIIKAPATQSKNSASTSLSLIQIPILDLKFRSCDERSLACIPFPLSGVGGLLILMCVTCADATQSGIHIASIFIYKNRLDLPQSAHNGTVHSSIPLNRLIPMAE